MRNQSETDDGFSVQESLGDTGSRQDSKSLLGNVESPELEVSVMVRAAVKAAQKNTNYEDITSQDGDMDDVGKTHNNTHNSKGKETERRTEDHWH